MMLLYWLLWEEAPSVSSFYHLLLFKKKLAKRACRPSFREILVEECKPLINIDDFKSLHLLRQHSPPPKKKSHFYFNIFPLYLPKLGLYQADATVNIMGSWTGAHKNEETYFGSTMKPNTPTKQQPWLAPNFVSFSFSGMRFHFPRCSQFFDFSRPPPPRSVYQWNTSLCQSLLEIWSLLTSLLFCCLLLINF